MRSFIVILNVLGVLLCPYDCAVRTALGKSMTGQSAVPACCAKCRVHQQTNDQNSPRPDDPRKDGHSCLCEGAVFTTSTHQDLGWLLVDSQLALCIDVPAVLGSDAPTSAISPDESPPPHASGRQIRIVMLSLVI